MDHNNIDILTQDLSDPKLTEFPICAAGTYSARIQEPPVYTVDDEGGHSLRFNVLLTAPAMRHNSNDPWEQNMPLRGYIGLTPKGKATLDMIRRNCAVFVQAGKQRSLMTAEQADMVRAGSKEVQLPQYVGSEFNVSVSVTTMKNNQQLTNNVNILL